MQANVAFVTYALSLTPRYGGEDGAGGGVGGNRRALKRLMKDNVAQIIVLRLRKEKAEGGASDASNGGGAGNVDGSDGGSSHGDKPSSPYSSMRAKERSVADGAAPQPPVEFSDFCLCNTHLLSNVEYEDVKLWQAHVLVSELEKVSTERAQARATHLQHRGGASLPPDAVPSTPVVLCGDFNCLPDTCCYHYIAGDWQAMAASWPADPTHLLPADPSHGLHLASSYRAVTGAEPPFTNFTESFKGTLDYIWSTAGSLHRLRGVPATAPRLEPVSVLGMPTADDITAHSRCPLPNAQFASDHMPLVCDMSFLPPPV